MTSSSLAISGSKRKFSEHLGEIEGSGTSSSKVQTEEWSLRDVVFVDHVTNLQIGSVVKLDGNYVAVHYPALDHKELLQVDINKCRLLRKEDLVVSEEVLDRKYNVQWNFKCWKSQVEEIMLYSGTPYRGTRESWVVNIIVVHLEKRL